MTPLTFMQAVAREEGFNVQGSRPNRNNNPGDIEYGRFTKSHGATGGDPRFAVFPDASTGFNAMRALLQSAYLGLTVEQALNKWAPPAENDVSAYLKNVLSWTGMAADTVLTAENIG